MQFLSNTRLQNRRPTQRRGRPGWSALAALAGALAVATPIATHAFDAAGRALSPRVLIVGGGPDVRNNHVSIESNVRYLSKLLPRSAQHITLFADGDLKNATVLYDDEMPELPVAQRVFNLVMFGAEDGEESTGKHRTPKLGLKLDGASRKPEIERAFTQLTSAVQPSDTPVLLYFTGHGSRNNDMENNSYDLWGPHDGLSVRELSRQIGRLPAETPVTVVMVQCFSGAFGNLIFEGGDPKGEPIQRDLAGFFATRKDRFAAGCTSAVNEKEYHDFTSYFFAALTGRDRVGRRVTGADYNGDGQVEMNEAFCYTLIHDESIDVPICTSDVFLRRYVAMTDPEVFRTPYSDVLSWANPAQRAVLEALSRPFGSAGDNPLSVAYSRFNRRSSGQESRAGMRDAQQRFDSIRNEARRNLTGRWPDLRRPGTDEYRLARKEALAQLARDTDSGRWRDLLDASEALDKAAGDAEKQEIADSKGIRLVSLAKSVVLAHWLNEHGAAQVKTRYARLVEAENRTLLSRADADTKRDSDGSALLTAPASAHRAAGCCGWADSPDLDAPRVGNGRL